MPNRTSRSDDLIVKRTKTTFLQNALGGTIPLVCTRKNSGQPQLTKAESDESVSCLRRETESPVPACNVLTES